jgi:hypothetical protein
MPAFAAWAEKMDARDSLSWPKGRWTIDSAGETRFIV